MDNFEEKVYSYGMMSPDEQQRINLFVLKHPEYAETLEEVKELYSLLQKAQIMQDKMPDDVALAYYVAQENLQSASVPDGMAAVYAKLKEQVESNVEVFEQYQAIKKRMEAVAAQSNPLAEFERLTGVDVGGMPRVAKVPSFQNGKKERPPLVRERSLTDSRWARASLYTLAAIGIAFLFILQDNRVAKMAYLDPVAFHQSHVSALRGAESSNGGEVSASGESEAIKRSELRVRFDQGLEMMYQSQKTKLSLFYAHDLDMLKKAEDQFTDILQAEVSGVLLKDEVSFVLAKIYIAQHRFDEARVLLREVAHPRGSLAGEANLLLEKL